MSSHAPARLPIPVTPATRSRPGNAGCERRRRDAAKPNYPRRPGGGAGLVRVGGPRSRRGPGAVSEDPAGGDRAAPRVSRSGLVGVEETAEGFLPVRAAAGLLAELQQLRLQQPAF